MNLQEKKKSCHKGTYPFPYCNEGDHSNRFKTHEKLFFWIFNNICHIPEWILLIFKNSLFFKIHLRARLNILCSDPHNFLKEVTKKIRKVHKNIFCGPTKILKNISWPINICLKYFMASAKTLRSPLLYT